MRRSQKLAGSAAPARNVKVRIYGDKRNFGKTSVDVELPLDMPTEQIVAHCTGKLGFAACDTVVLHNQSSIISHMCFEIPPLAFTVTPHKESYYDTPLAGLRVYEDEKLITGLNRGFEKEVECSIKGTNESLSFDNGNLEISFNRTIRVPDDGREHPLPPGLGKFPIFNIADYEKKLPADMREKGGVFIPMYQREAMWMSFHAKRQFAIKIYLGGVNGISGEPMIPNMATYLKRANKATRKQDYIVVPSQPWLDGVAVSPGLVKQFVAMPFGSGYSVEKQVTGEESVGGMQFEVIPAYDKEEYFLSRDQFFEEMVAKKSLDAMVTAKRLGLQPGEMIYCKRIKETKMRVRTVKDLLSDSGALLELDLCKMINTNLRVRILGKESSYSVHGDSTKPFESIGIEMERRAGLPRAGRCFCIGGKEVKTWKDMYRLMQASSEGFGAGAGARSDIPLDWARQLTLEIETYNCYPPFSCKVAESETVMSLKERICEMGIFTTDLETVYVTFGNQWLQNEQTLGSSGVVNGDVLIVGKHMRGGCSLVSPENRQMAIAVGGTVKQDIHPDYWHPESWNTENVKLLNVQVVNSVAFEGITGMAAPKTPIGPETYASMGLPFFELYREQPSTVGGDFSKVKTVSEMDATLQAGGSAAYNPAVAQICTVCKTRIRDCLMRPCNHRYCNQCAKQMLIASNTSSGRCPQCRRGITHIEQISAPMNAPGHEGRNRPFKVITLDITDRRERFTSIKQQVGRG